MKTRYILGLAVLSLAPLTHADVWTIRADNWCPYNCEPKSAQPGYMIEIIQAAAKTAGHTVDYATTPWSRALSEARNGQINGVVGMATGDREGMLVTDKLGVDTTCFFVNAGDSLKYSSPADLAKLQSVGTIQSYVYPDEFMNWQKSNPSKVQSAAGDNALELNIKKLTGKRFQAFIENETVVNYLRKSQPALKDVVSAGCMESTDLFAGFGAKNPKSADIVKAINAKTAEMKKSGELKKLLDKYGAKAW
ncbi:substrate-binding periplasmic protein [Rhodoferax aquaticus]|nr:transporter substrate-binding domain-containing protein [Rhodoferax aquaticus]